MPQQGAPPPFELVKQFQQMRNGMGGAPTPLSSYAPQSQDPASAYTGMGNFGAPGMTASPVSAGTGQGLVNYGSKQVAAGLAPYADTLTQKFGLRLSGGYRSPAANARTPGAAKNSYHMRQGSSGALDLVGTARQMQDAAAWAKQNGAKETLIHNAGTGLHLHVAW